MSSINGLGGNSPINKLTSQPIYKSLPTEQPQAPARASDKLELSGLSHLLKAAQQNDVRVDKVAQVKAAIEAGTYDDDAKLDAAIDRLLDDVLK
jgi:anti-sigma28 factor (negative regulator of flagellin synthesis)